MKHEKSEALFKRAEKVLPGGVNAPVRAFQNVGTHPIFVRSGSGARLIDVDGNNYIDYVMSSGPLILGHASRNILAGAYEVMSLGSTFGLPTEIEIEMAETLSGAIPGMEQIRMVSSETEAAMSAIHLAKGYTGRSKLILFKGNYYAGIPGAATKDTLTADYNDLDAVRSLFEQYQDQIACIIVEPVSCSRGVILPEEGFLEGLREITSENGALLIFDETITAFRVAYGGAQTKMNIRPDLTCLGRIIGGGMPIGAFGGPRKIMNSLAPEGPVYQSGTPSCNPVVLRMGLNCLSYLKAHPEVYLMLENRTDELADGLEDAIRETGIKATVTRYTGMCSLFFTDREIRNDSDIRSSDEKVYAQYFREMLSRGYLFPPSQYEGIYLSAAHTKYDITRTVKDSREVFETLAGN